MGSYYPSTSRKNIKYIYRYFCSVLLTLIATIIFYITWIGLVATHNLTGKLLGLGNRGMAIGIYMILFVTVGRWLRAYKIGVERIANVMASQFLTILVVGIMEVFVSCAITNQFRYVFDFIIAYFFMFVKQAFINCVLVVLMVKVYRKTFPPLNIIEIYTEESDNYIGSRMNNVRFKYSVKERILASTDEEIIRNKIVNYDAVILNDIPAHDRNRLLKLCYEVNRRAYYLPKISDVIVKNSEELNLIDAPVFMNRNNGITIWQRFLKRFFDIVLSLLAILVFCPFMLITAIAIYLEDRGPVIFKQERVTLGGRRFMILKFRSMIVDAEKDGKPHPAGENDDRITKVGKIIRSIRFDELPQLFNILKGDMSIVGPRPERWEHVEEYSKLIPEFKFRHKMKGGLTGYAQVYGKYNTTALDKLKLDLLYITNYSLSFDLQIIFETLKILFVKESTEGFSEEAGKKLHDGKSEKEEDY